ncbi:hypothetical protein [Sinomicrobium sp. M5D2P9]
MKFQYLVFSVFFLLCWYTSAQNMDCSNVRTGIFKMEDKNAGPAIITRNDSTQVEFMEKLKLKIELNVHWVNDFTFTLTLARVLENPDDLPVFREMIVTSEILEVKEHSYVQKSTSNVSDKVMISELFRTEQ